nr:hypothetical protein [Rhizobium mesoamericanum]
MMDFVERERATAIIPLASHFALFRCEQLQWHSGQVVAGQIGVLE